MFYLDFWKMSVIHVSPKSEVFWQNYGPLVFLARFKGVWPFSVGRLNNNIDNWKKEKPRWKSKTLIPNNFNFIYFFYICTFLSYLNLKPLYIHFLQFLEQNELTSWSDLNTPKCRIHWESFKDAETSIIP